MRTRTRLLIECLVLASIQLIGAGCEGSNIVDFPRADGGPDVPIGTGGNAGGGSGTAGSGGAAGAGGTNGGNGGTAGNSGAAGGGGAAGSSGASGNGGAGGSSGAAGTSGASGSGGAAGSSGAPSAGGAAGTSGTSGSGGTGGNTGASDAGGASGSAGNSGSAGTGIDAGTDTDVDAADVRTDGDATADVAGDGDGDAGCPDVFGAYAINNADGNCGDLDEDAAQEIRGTTQVCFLHFISVVDSGAGAINGGAVLGPDGTFSGATLTLGTATRSSCTGSWNQMEEEITIVCGSGADECLVELRRSGP